MSNALDTKKFNEEVLDCYNRGCGDGLIADMETATSFVPIGTSELRDFSYIAPEIPEFISANCVGCMECVTECPDTAILGKVIPRAQLDAALAAMPADKRANVETEWSKTRKYWQAYEKQ